MIQGGGMTRRHEGEADARADRRSRASNGLTNAARHDRDGAHHDPNSATAQFFINVKDNDFLEPGASRATATATPSSARSSQGMDVVDKIRPTPTGAAATCRCTPVIIKKATVEK